MVSTHEPSVCNTSELPAAPSALHPAPSAHVGFTTEAPSGGHWQFIPRRSEDGASPAGNKAAASQPQQTDAQVDATLAHADAGSAPHPDADTWAPVLDEVQGELSLIASLEPGELSRRVSLQI
jgi:hypothetical protein